MYLLAEHRDALAKGAVPSSFAYDHLLRSQHYFAQDTLLGIRTNSADIGTAVRILITGGAGFVGATLAFRAADARHEVGAFDNLHQRGASGLIGSDVALAVAGA